MTYSELDFMLLLAIVWLLYGILMSLNRRRRK